MKKLLRFALCSTFVSLLMITEVKAQPPFFVPEGSVTMGGAHIMGMLTLPYVEENSTNYYSFWIHGDPQGNPASGILNITSVSMMGSSDFTIDQNPSGTSLVNYSDSAMLKIKFVPSTSGEKEASCLIQNNGMTLMVSFKSSTPPGSIVWQGNTSVSGSEIQLGDGEVNTTSVFSMSFKNTGSSPINMTSSSITGSSDFTLIEVPNNTTVNSMESAVVKVQFVPTATGEQTAQLTLVQDLYTYTFTLRAVGINTTTATLGTVSSDWKVYPNPVTDRLFISGDAQSVNYQVIDIAGKVIQKGTTLTNNSISLQNVNQGLYQLQWSNAGKSFSRLISKQ